MSSCQEHQNTMIKHFLLLSYEDWFYWLSQGSYFVLNYFVFDNSLCILCFNNHDIMRNCVDITQQDVSLGFVQKYRLRTVFLSN